MQISAANLLLAGQQPLRPQAPQPATAATKNSVPEFAPLEFKRAASPDRAPAPENTPPPAPTAQTLQRPGAQLDIRV